jgi:pyruvate, water dikinase
VYTLDFNQIGLGDVARVGGKNASLGELFQNLKPLGVNAVDGFATTAEAFHRFLQTDGLDDKLSEIMFGLEPNSIDSLAATGEYARTAVISTNLPANIVAEIEDAYDRLCERLGRTVELAVRSSATAEDLPGASFAGQHETFLNVQGKAELIEAVHKCYASLFTDRAIDYRIRNGFDYSSIALSVGVQPMVRSDLASAGVIFTLDTETGFPNVVEVTGSYGLGELVVQGSVIPDEWTVFKPTLKSGHLAIVSRRLGSKEQKLTFSSTLSGTRKSAVPSSDRARFSLSDDEVLQLSTWACQIEDHYSNLSSNRQPMDIEWAKDGETGELFITQARPETVHASRSKLEARSFRLTGHAPEPILSGQAVGEMIASGPVRVIESAAELSEVKPGDVLVTRATNPDWEPVMKRVAAIVTDQGGRTSHAAIVSREIGIPCIVGTQFGTQRLEQGQLVTVSCAEGTEGRIYPGEIPFIAEVISPETGKTRTKVMLIVGDPSKAFSLATLPNDGVGLARMEFIVTDSIGVHPMALCRYPHLRDTRAIRQIRTRLAGLDPKEFFIQRLSEGIATIAAAFYPKPVIVRTSDFKTNEYAQLIGGSEFEPHEENPMLGFRGASRYYDARYAEGFALECHAILRVRELMGLTNVKVMIPFCRMVAEAQKVVETMAAHGLVQGRNGLEIYGMCEIPSNALNANQFLRVFDGYSIGSNDLTQLALGIDRDSGSISHLFDERDPSVKALIAMAIQSAHLNNKSIGICGQAPSDYPEFARWLVELGIDSISLNPDSVIKALAVIAEAEHAQESPELLARA